MYHIFKKLPNFKKKNLNVFMREFEHQKQGISCYCPQTWLKPKLSKLSSARGGN